MDSWFHKERDDLLVLGLVHRINCTLESDIRVCVACQTTTQVPEQTKIEIQIGTDKWHDISDYVPASCCNKLLIHVPVRATLRREEKRGKCRGQPLFLYLKARTETVDRCLTRIEPGKCTYVRMQAGLFSFLSFPILLFVLPFLRIAQCPRQSCSFVPLYACPNHATRKIIIP